MAKRSRKKRRRLLLLPPPTYKAVIAIVIGAAVLAGLIYFTPPGKYILGQVYQITPPVTEPYLLGHWKFDEGRGSTPSDASGNGLTGYLISMEQSDWDTSTNQAVIGSGIVNPAHLEFNQDSGDESVFMKAPPALDFGWGDSFSWSAWFQTSTPSLRQTIAGKKRTVSVATEPGYSSGIHVTDKHLCFLADGTKQVFAASTVSVTDGGWHHSVCVVDRQANILSSYVDGVLSGSVSIASIGSPATTANFRAGLEDNNTRRFRGHIDDVRVYRGALSALQVKALTQHGTLTPSPSPEPLPAPVRHWKLDAPVGSATTYVYDSSKNASHGNWKGLYARPWVADVAPLVPSPNPAALTFDGRDDFVMAPDVDFTNQMSGSLWVKLNKPHKNYTSNPPLITSDQLLIGSEREYKLTSSADGGLSLSIFTGKVTTTTNEGVDTVTSNTSLQVGQWYHIAWTYDGDSTKLYVNGTLQTNTIPVGFPGGNQNGPPGNIADNNSYVTLGAVGELSGTTIRGTPDLRGSSFLVGTLDDVRLYDKVLSAAQINALAIGKAK